MAKLKFVVVTAKSYGNLLRGTKIYYEGVRPKGLRDDGTIKFGKHILEAIKATLKGKRFMWILTPAKDSVRVEEGVHRIRTSAKTLARMNAEFFGRTRDIKLDIVAQIFAATQPTLYKGKKPALPYAQGDLARLLAAEPLKQLSAADKEAMSRFLPDFIAQESLSAVNLLKAKTQIKTLRELAEQLEAELARSRTEHWWQDYIHKNILLIQQGYIAAIEKLNIAVGTVKWPDFSLVTHDNYLDILEIKKPDTALLQHDAGRGNYFWSAEMSKAVIQTENYIHNVQRHGDAVRSYIKDELEIDLKVMRPRGIILAGNATKLGNQKERDDFRLLTQSVKNIVFVTYDELLGRLKNYIGVLEKHSARAKRKV